MRGPVFLEVGIGHAHVRRGQAGHASRELPLQLEEADLGSVLVPDPLREERLVGNDEGEVMGFAWDYGASQAPAASRSMSASAGVSSDSFIVA